MSVSASTTTRMLSNVLNAKLQGPQRVFLLPLLRAWTWSRLWIKVHLLNWPAQAFLKSEMQNQSGIRSGLTSAILQWSLQVSLKGL